jgi:outer membrane protein
MKLKFTYCLAAVVVLSAGAFAQAGASSSAALPAAPGATSDPPAVALNPNATKIAVINVENAILLTNEGQRDMGALQKKFEPKRSDLNNRRDEVEGLRKQMNAAGATDAKKTELQREIDQKQKALERDAQDAQEDYQGQQTEIGQRIFQKLGPVIMKYAQDNNLGMIIDTSTPWPNGPVLWANPASMDITKAIADAYNAQSGVAPPAAGSTAKPAGTTGLSRPVPSKPATTSPPNK